MRRIRRSLPIALLALAVAVPAVRADQAERLDQVIDGFAAAVKANESLAEDVRTRAEAIIESLRADEGTREATITLALREVYPDFAAALTTLGEERIDEATAQLKTLAAHDDPYLAAESSFFLARAHMMEDHYEQALPHLDKLVGDWSDKSLYASEAMFLRGISQVRLLDRKEARASLETYLKENPNASERMRIAAWRMIELLELFEEGSMIEVKDLMDFSRRRLTLEYSGDKTREAQDKAVALLDKLIEKAEEQEQQGQGQGEGKKQGEKKQGENEGQKQGEGEGQGQSKSGQGGSKQNDQDAEKVVRQLRAGPKTPWDHLRDAERQERAFAALKAKFPARYRELVEQYFLDLQLGDQDE